MLIPRNSDINAGESFQMQILFNIFPRISLHCKLVPVQYWEYEYGLLTRENEGSEREAQGVGRDMLCPRKLFLDERKSLF